MNGPISMYRLKPLVHFSDVADPCTTMYRMKNIYSSNFSSPEVNDVKYSLPNVLEQVNKLLKKPASEVEDLKKRQEGILKQLNFLKEQMLALREELSKGTSNKKAPSEVRKNLDITSSHKMVHKPCWNGVVDEIVISASPENPPYSLLAVNHLWPDVLRLHVTCHTHSSIVSLPPHLSCFSSLSHTLNPNLRARLIWNNMGLDCELVISPLTHFPIRGEVNVLRYLHRTICGVGDVVADTQLDHLLDVCHRLVHVHTQRDRQLNVRMLNALLGRTPWLGGEAMSVADVAAWSAVRSVPGLELSQNMTRWNARCCAAFGIEAA